MPAEPGPGPAGCRPRSIRRRLLPAGAAGLVAALVAAGLLARPWLARRGAPPGPEPVPLPPVSASPFLNTGPGAEYVGSEACRSCHRKRDASFRRTPMGQSMAEIDPSHEPADVDLDHPPSQRRYQVRRRGEQ